MAEGIEIGFIGKITYYTIVVYLLFIVGLIIVCRHRYKSRQKHNKGKDSSTDNSKEKKHANEDMGCIESKNKRGYRVNNDSNVIKRNVSKQATLADDVDTDRPMSSGNIDSEGAVARLGHRNLVIQTENCNKNVTDSTNNTDLESTREFERNCDVISSTDCDQATSDYSVNRENVEKREITREQLISANANKTENASTQDQKTDELPEVISTEEMGRQTDQETVNHKEISLNSFKLEPKFQSDNDCLNPDQEDLDCSDDTGANSILNSTQSSTDISRIDSRIDNFADQVISDVLIDAYEELESRLSEIASLAESVVELSLQDVLIHVNDNKVLLDFAAELSSEIFNVLTIDKDQIVKEHNKLKAKKAAVVKKSSSSSLQSKEDSKVLSESSSGISEITSSKTSSLESSPIKVRDTIKRFSENLSTSILDFRTQTGSSNTENIGFKIKEYLTKSSEITRENLEDNYPALQRETLRCLSDQLANKILEDCLEEITSTAQVMKDQEAEAGVHVTQCGSSNKVATSQTSPVLKCDTVDKDSTSNIPEKAPKLELNGISSKSENSLKNNGKPQNQVTLRNKNLLKVKLHTDRPLSNYAEQLASFLVDDDDSLDLFESDDEFDAVLGKMEQKFKDDEKISSKIQRRRKMSDRKDVHTSNKSRQAFKNSDSDGSNENVFGMEARGRLGSSQSDSSFFSDTDTDEMRRGSFSDDQVLTPGFSKYNLKSTVVIDAGGGILKAGLAGEVAPRSMLPSVIGVPRRFSQDLSQIGRGYYVGEDAMLRAGMLQLDHPIKQNVKNWSDVNSIIEYLLEVELQVNAREHPVLLTETGLISKKQREKLTEIMFEKHGVPAFYLANQGPLSLYSMGLMSGLCLNVGFASTQSIPVYEGHALDYCTQQLDVGGQQISNHLGRLLLSGKGLAFSTSSERFILNNIKERIAYVAENPKMEQEKLKKFPDEVRQFFTLPDGQELEIDVERFRSAEILFDPEELGLQQKPIHSMMMDSIAIADNSLQSTLTNNVVVSGGSSLLPGLTKRLTKELDSLTECTTSLRISHASNPITATWTGGSVISSRSTFFQQCITTDEYAEKGASVVHMKCF